jgi:hypothetical protein
MVAHSILPLPVTKRVVVSKVVRIQSWAWFCLHWEPMENHCKPGVWVSEYGTNLIIDEQSNILPPARLIGRWLKPSLCEKLAPTTRHFYSELAWF